MEGEPIQPNSNHDENNDAEPIQTYNPVEAIYGELENNAQRIEAVIAQLGPFFKIKSNDLDIEAICHKIRQCQSLPTRQEFIDGVSAELQPLYDFRKNNLGLFEAIDRETFVSNGGFTKINEVLSYGQGSDGWLHIHLAPARTLKNVKSLIIDGLKELAQRAKADSSIQGLTATSWIVAKNPGILEKLGFTYKGELPDEMRQRHFSEETRTVGRAIISRDELINKYS
jgi:hypothetical protein